MRASGLRDPAQRIAADVAFNVARSDVAERDHADKAFVAIEDGQRTNALLGHVLGCSLRFLGYAASCIRLRFHLSPPRIASTSDHSRKDRSANGRAAHQSHDRGLRVSASLEARPAGAT